jgi:putative hydrolase of the HAD superfamily
MPRVTDTLWNSSGLAPDTGFSHGAVMIQTQTDSIKQRADLTHIDTWIFDLDNTLYPAKSELFAQIDQRITTFVAEFLSLDHDSARIVQKQMFHGHGTTLNGLMKDHALDPHVFLEFVHDIDVSVLDRDPDLRQVLATLPGRRLIYTNGSVAHAARIARHLGIDDLFHGVHDIVAADFIPKPSTKAFQRFLDDHEINPQSAVFFDDIPHNLEPAHELGLTTVWIDDPSEWSRPGGMGDHIHHRAGSLKSFLLQAEWIRPMSNE